MHFMVSRSSLFLPKLRRTSHTCPYSLADPKYTYVRLPTSRKPLCVYASAKILTVSNSKYNRIRNLRDRKVESAFSKAGIKPKTSSLNAIVVTVKFQVKI